MKKVDFLILTLVGAYIFLLPFVPSAKYEWLLSSIFVIIGFIYLIELVFVKEKRIEFKENYKKIFSNFFTITFMLFIFIMILTTWKSVDKMVSLKESMRYVYYLGIYFVIRFRITDEKMYEIFIKVYLSSTLPVCLIGIMDFLKHYKKGQTIEVILNTARAESTIGHPNSYAAYLILAIFPAILIALKSNGFKKVYYVILAVLMCTNLAITFSRNGWIALVLGILALSVAYNWKFIFLYIIPGIYLLLSNNVALRLKQVMNSAYNEGRFKLWRIAEKMIKENMFLGVGSGNFRSRYASYIARFPELKVNEAEILPPHNSYIRAFAELGVFGAVTFLVMCFDMLRTLYYVRLKVSGIIEQFYSGFLISAMCFLMMNCFDDLFYAPKVTINFFIFVFISYNLNYMVKKDKEQSII